MRAIPGVRILDPRQKRLVDRVKGDSDLLAATNPSAKVPVDLVTTSASGLDPDITPAAALFQIPWVAKARGLPEDQLRRLVEENTAGRLLGILGEPHVNVLKLNLALDKAFPAQERRETKENPSAAEVTPAPPAPAVGAPVATAPVPPHCRRAAAGGARTGDARSSCRRGASSAHGRVAVGQSAREADIEIGRSSHGSHGGRIPL